MAAARSAPRKQDISLLDRDVHERLIAGVRFVAALVMLAALATDIGPLHSTLVKLLVLAYTAHAAAMLLVFARRPEWVIRHVGVLHGIDLAWTAAATTVSGGASSHVFPFFAFLLATAAFRWGMLRALVDAGLIVLVASAQIGLAGAGLVAWTFEWDIFVVQSSLMIGLALLLGVFSEREHTLRLQVATAELVSRLSRAPRLAPAVRDTLAHVVRLFGAARAILVVQDPDAPALYLWEAEAQAADVVAVAFTTPARDEAVAWYLDPPLSVSTCEVRRSAAGGGGGGGGGVVSVSAALGGRGVATTCALPPAIAGASAWTTLVTAPISANRIWSGRIYVLDPSRRPRGELRLRVLQRMVAQVSPALLTLYLLRRLRTRAESIERTRISKELHAGPLQSLAALEMRLDVLRRQADRVAPSLSADVVDVRDLLHETAIEVRELMHRLRSSRVDVQRLPQDLEDLVQRFGRTTGVNTRFVWAVSGLHLTPQQCAAVVRLTQDALFSARRHREATSVLVRMEADAAAWGLIVEDQGRDEPAAGRPMNEPLADGRAVRALRERVMALGGTLQARTSPEGTRLEMVFPRVGQSISGVAGT